MHEKEMLNYFLPFCSIGELFSLQFKTFQSSHMEHLAMNLQKDVSVDRSEISYQQ